MRVSNESDCENLILLLAMLFKQHTVNILHVFLFRLEYVDELGVENPH